MKLYYLENAAKSINILLMSFTLIKELISFHLRVNQLVMTKTREDIGIFA